MLKFRSLSNVHLGPEGEISLRPWPEGVGVGSFSRITRSLLLEEGHGCWLGRRTDASPISQMKKPRLRPLS